MTSSLALALNYPRSLTSFCSALPAVQTFSIIDGTSILEEQDCVCFVHCLQSMTDKDWNILFLRSQSGKSLLLWPQGVLPHPVRHSPSGRPMKTEPFRDGPSSCPSFIVSTTLPVRILTFTGSSRWTCSARWCIQSVSPLHVSPQSTTQPPWFIQYKKAERKFCPIFF